MENEDDKAIVVVEPISEERIESVKNIIGRYTDYGEKDINRLVEKYLK